MTDHRRWCAYGSAGLLSAIGAFQLALVAGAPWGEATQGGRARTVDGVLATEGRALAGVSACALLVAAYVVLARGGIIRHARLTDDVLRRASWALVVFLALNTAANLTGRHPFERWGMSAVSATAMVLTARVARPRRLAGHAH